MKSSCGQVIASTTQKSLSRPATLQRRGQVGQKMALRCNPHLLTIPRHHVVTISFRLTLPHPAPPHAGDERSRRDRRDGTGWRARASRYESEGRLFESAGTHRVVPFSRDRDATLSPRSIAPCVHRTRAGSSLRVKNLSGHPSASVTPAWAFGGPQEVRALRWALRVRRSDRAVERL